MNKKSLLSVLLVAVLLAACVLGVLMTGANASAEATVYTIRDDGNDDGSVTEGDTIVFKTIKGATTYAKAQVWEAGAALRIELDQETVTTTKDNNLIFETSANTMILREDGSLLPITVTKSENQDAATLAVNASGNLVFANYYTFEDLTMTFNAKVTIYVVQHVEFKNVALTGAAAQSGIRATGNTQSAYAINADNVEGRLDENGDLTAEIIFSGNTTVCENFEQIMALGSVTRVYQEKDYFPESETFGDVTLTHSDFNGRIVVKDNAQIPGKVYGKAEGSPLGSAEVIVEGGKLSRFAIGLSASTLKEGETTRVVFKGGEIAGGAYAVSGAATIKSGAEAAIVLDGGVTTSDFRINDGNSFVAEAGATVAAYLNSGTFSGKDKSLLNAGSSKDTVSGCRAGSRAVVELNGAIIGQTSGTANFMFYPFRYGTFNCDLYFTITSLENTNEKGFYRWIKDSIVNGDIYTTIDTTVDGWKTNPDGTRAADDSDENKPGATVNFSGYIGDWDGFLNGNSYTRINGGNNRDSIYIKYFYSVNGANIYTEAENSTYYYFGLVRGAGSSGIQNIDTKLTGIKATNVYCAGSNYANLNPSVSLNTTLTNCTITGSVFSDSTATTLQANVTVDGENTEIAKILSKDETDANANVVIKNGKVTDTLSAKNITIYNANLKCNPQGNAVLAGGTLTISGTDVTVEIDSVLAQTNVVRDSGYIFKEGHSMLTVPSQYDSLITLANNRSPRGYMWKNMDKNPGFVTVEGKCPSAASAVLELGDRTIVKFLIAKDAVEHAKQYSENEFYYWCEALGIPSTNPVLIENWDLPVYDENYYYVELPSVGAGDFGKNLYFFTDTFAAVTTSINAIATKGVETYETTDPAAAALFKALLDYGKSTVEGTTALDYFDGNALAANINKLPATTGAVKETGATIDVSAVTVLMGDTMGIRFKTESDLTGLSLKVNGQNIGKDFYSAANGCIDLYINAANLNEALTIEIYDGQTLCLTMNESVSTLVYKIYSADKANLKAAAVLELILAVEAVKAAA